MDRFEEYPSLSDVYSPRYPIGEGTYGGLSIYSWDEKTKLEIGKYCSFGFGCTIVLGGGHRADWVTTYPFTELWKDAPKIPGHPSTKGDIKIGSDVWVGAEAMILSGVTIGDGAVIGARAVVTRNVQPYQVVAGSPAKPVDWRFNQEVITELLRIKWWDWPRDRILKALPMMLNTGIEHFIFAVDEGKL